MSRLEKFGPDTKCWKCGEKNFDTDPHYPSSIGIETNKHTCKSCGKHWQTLKDVSVAHSFVAPWAAKKVVKNADRFVKA